MKTYVLDASAILNLVQDSSGAEKVDRLVQEAFYKNNTLLISVANWGEVFYYLWERTGEEKARQTIANLSRLPLQIIPVDLVQALKAGEIKAIHKIPYVDCIAAALAVLQQATLVTSDRDFERLGRNFPILWIAHW